MDQPTPPSSESPSMNVTSMLCDSAPAQAPQLSQDTEQPASTSYAATGSTVTLSPNCNPTSIPFSHQTQPHFPHFQSLGSSSSPAFVAHSTPSASSSPAFVTHSTPSASSSPAFVTHSTPSASSSPAFVTHSTPSASSSPAFVTHSTPSASSSPAFVIHSTPSASTSPAFVTHSTPSASSVSVLQQDSTVMNVPAIHPVVSPSATPSQQLGGLGRGSVPIPESISNASKSYNFQGHGTLRYSHMASHASPSTSTSQSTQLVNPRQPSGPQRKPPLPSPSYKPQPTVPTFQQRLHIPPSVTPNPSQFSVPPEQPLQPSVSSQSSRQHGKQVAPSMPTSSLPHVPQISKVPGSMSQKFPSSPMTPAVQLATQNLKSNVDSDEPHNRILRKGVIHDLVSQIDPMESLDPEVEDVLIDIADDFVESITTFGCSLAKHRKSDTLEAKDILVHIERNWNMMLPGFCGDEIKTYKKPITNDVHKERLAVIKKSMLVSDLANAKSSVAQAAVIAKSNQL